MKLLGVDFGTSKTGLATGDTELRTALPSEVVMGDADAVCQAIATRVSEDDFDEVIIGLPRNMKGEDSKQTIMTRAFMARLSRLLSVPVKSFDERLTTAAANSLGTDSDDVAAQIMLQTYIDTLS